MPELEVRPLADGEVAQVDAQLPLHRLDQPHSRYLVAWAGDDPLGHVCVKYEKLVDSGGTRTS